MTCAAIFWSFCALGLCASGCATSYWMYTSVSSSDGVNFVATTGLFRNCVSYNFMGNSVDTCQEAFHELKQLPRDQTLCKSYSVADALRTAYSAQYSAIAAVVALLGGFLATCIASCGPKYRPMRTVVSVTTAVAFVGVTVACVQFFRLLNLCNNFCSNFNQQTQGANSTQCRPNFSTFMFILSGIWPLFALCSLLRARRPPTRVPPPAAGATAAINTNADGAHPLQTMQQPLLGATSNAHRGRGAANTSVTYGYPPGAQQQTTRAAASTAASPSEELDEMIRIGVLDGEAPTRMDIVAGSLQFLVHTLHAPGRTSHDRCTIATFAAALRPLVHLGDEARCVAGLQSARQLSRSGGGDSVAVYAAAQQALEHFARTADSSRRWVAVVVTNSPDGSANAAAADGLAAALATFTAARADGTPPNVALFVSVAADRDVTSAPASSGALSLRDLCALSGAQCADARDTRLMLPRLLAHLAASAAEGTAFDAGVALDSTVGVNAATARAVDAPPARPPVDVLLLVCTAGSMADA